jgi:hypothetical protein
MMCTRRLPSSGHDVISLVRKERILWVPDPDQDPDLFG